MVPNNNFKKVNFIFLITLLLLFFSCKKKDGNNGNNVIIGEHFNSNLNYGTVVDIDGNVYKTIDIGCDTCPYPQNYKKTWMAENLKVKHFQNGDPIDSAGIHSVSVPKWCYYEDNPSNNTIHGKLYNYPVVIDNRNVCPTGWHVPNKSDWMGLLTYLDSNTDQNFGYSLSECGGDLKSTGTLIWDYPNGEANNSSGFSSVPSGKVTGSNSSVGMGNTAQYWLVGEYGSSNKNNTIHLFYYSKGVSNVEELRDVHVAIRCVKN